MDSSSFDNEKEIRNEQVNDDPSFSAEQERRLVRKFDFRLLPFLSFMYLFSSLDRSSVGMFFFDIVWYSHNTVIEPAFYFDTGNAVLDNFEQDLGMTGNQLNTAITIFYVINFSEMPMLYPSTLAD